MHKSFELGLRLSTLCLLSMGLLACVGNPQAPEGYFPDSARMLQVEYLEPMKKAPWSGTRQLMLAGIDGQNLSDSAWAGAYLRQRYPQLPEADWYGFNSGVVLFAEQQAQGFSVANAFAAPRSAGAIFEPLPPLPLNQRQNYLDRLQALQAWPRSLKQALDAGDLWPGVDYLASSGPLQQPGGETGIAQFFDLQERPKDAHNAQLIYGSFVHYSGAGNSDAAVPGTLVTLYALYFDQQQQLFYWQSADQQKHWLFGLAHPQARLVAPWSGDKKLSVAGVTAQGGQCGKSVREWFETQSLDLPDTGFYHLGYGKVVFENGKPQSLSHPVAFDAKRAEGLVFEPKPDLSANDLADYQARITALKAKQIPLWVALDAGEIAPEQDYMGASRGSQALSHTGIVRFYKLMERPRGADGQTVYGVFIHNWNPRRRSGELSENALYRDEETGQFYWQAGKGRKMWIYGVARPLIKADKLRAETNKLPVSVLAAKQNF